MIATCTVEERAELSLIEFHLAVREQMEIGYQEFRPRPWWMPGWWYRRRMNKELGLVRLMVDSYEDNVLQVWAEGALLAWTQELLDG